MPSPQPPKEAVEAARAATNQPFVPANYPRDKGDLGRCERAYAVAPPHLQERMLPLLEKWRDDLAPEDSDA